MAMHDGLNVWPRLVNFAVDEPFEKTGAAIRVYRIAVQIVFDDVVRRDQRGRDRARHQITAGRLGMAQRNMTKAIDNPVGRKDAAGRGEIRDERSGVRSAGFGRHAHDNTLILTGGFSRVPTSREEVTRGSRP